jgi:hypothetical protein
MGYFLSEAEMRSAIAQYGRTLVPLPENAFDLIDAYPQPDGRHMLLDIPLWTLEEGRSDLLLGTKRDGTYEVAIQDLHVL